MAICWHCGQGERIRNHGSSCVVSSIAVLADNLFQYWLACNAVDRPLICLMRSTNRPRSIWTGKIKQNRGRMSFLQNY